jgi:hypothetical protein
MERLFTKAWVWCRWGCVVSAAKWRSAVIRPPMRASRLSPCGIGGSLGA